MEGFLKWTQTIATISKDAAYSYNLSNSLKLTNAIAGGQASTRRQFPMPLSQKISFECLWSIDDFTKISDISFFINSDDGNWQSTMGVRFDVASNSWQYFTETGVWQSFLNTVFAPKIGVGGPWHCVKFSGDLVNRKYLSFECDRLRFPLSAPLYFEAGGYQFADVGLWVRGCSGSNSGSFRG